MNLIERFAKECAEDSLLFQLKLHGVRFCCLFLHGSDYRYICPYADEETIRISEKGMDTMRYVCRYEGKGRRLRHGDAE